MYLFQKDWRHKALLATAIASLMGTTACDDTYDLSNVSTDITVGGYIAAPIGSTDTLRLSRLIDETEELIVDEDGAYALRTSGDLSVSVTPIDRINITDISATPVVIDIDVPDWGTQPIDISLELPVAATLNIDSEETIPDEVEALTEVEITPITTNLYLDLSLTDNTVFSRLADLRLENFHYDFPDVFIFAPGIEGMDYDTNTLTISRDFDANGDISVDLVVTGLKDLPAIQNGLMDFKEQIPCSGTVLANGQQISPSDLDGLTLTLSFTIPDFYIENAEGTFNSTIDIASKQVSMGDIPDVLNDENTEINLNSIGLAVDIDNPIGVPFSATIHLTALDASSQEINEKVTVTVPVAKAASQTVSTVTKYWITNSTTLDMPEGYTRLLVENLNKLVSKVPTYVNIDADVEIDRTQSHFITLGAEYSTSVDYALTMPFDFGANSKIVYRESVDGLNSDLKDIADKVSEMEVGAEIHSTVPLALDIAITPYDINGNDMSDRLEYTSEITLDPGTDDAPAQSKDIRLKEKVEGALESLERIDIVVNGNTEQATTVLKPSQYVVVEMKAYLPNGVHITDED